ncbi:MAG: Trimethylamine corrinoid protein [Methanomassiliicoccales archaeon PtaU1.Bin124]|nr:MAG: Trimethylamine corrinoid protein [Methanomassiliicoccales archaeon PtaU1.Bin124]
MVGKKEKVQKGLEVAVISGKREESVKYANMVIKEGLSPIEAIDHGLIKGMMIVGDKYAHHEIFLPQVLLAADSLYGALDILLPYIPKEDARNSHRVIIGVVEGDVHDIGKNIVKTMLTAAGFKLVDLGKDISDEEFVKAAKKHHPFAVALSTLMTPTMDSMKETVDALIESGIRADLKIIVGGAPTSQEFADEIGADLHGMNAQDAVAKLKSAMN